MPQPTPVTKSVNELELDPYNARLPDEDHGRDPDELLRIMARDYSLLELAQSFADNGYFLQEPLVATEEDEVLRVVEGNRRLAALKILHDPEVAETMHLPAEWQDLSAKWVERGEEEIPVLVYDERADVISFLGFRHISGIKKWEPVEKARFLNALLEGGGRSFRDTARMTGSKSRSVRDNFVAYRILLQARQAADIDTEKLEGSFGVFLRALSSAPVKRHIGVDVTNRTPGDLMDPVPPENSDELKEIVSWMFGLGDQSPVMRDSRQITKLGYILDSEEALKTLRASGDFNLALALTEGEERSLIENLNKASYHLDEIKRDVDRHRDNERVRELILRLQRSLDAILAVADLNSGTDES